MNLNKNNIFLTMLSLFILGNSSINNYQNIPNNTKLTKTITNTDTRISLTSMFIANKLENTVHVGQTSNLSKITALQIKSAISQEIARELATKVTVETTTQSDYVINITTINDKPLPNTINLTKSIVFKINISAKKTSKILKDEITLLCNVDYPIFDLDKFLQEALLEIYAYRNPFRFSKFKSLTDYQAPNKSVLKVNLVGSPILNKNVSTFNCVSESFFENNSDKDQTYLTPPITKSIGNKVSVELSTGVAMGLTATFSIFGFSFELDFNVQQTIISKDEKVYTAPSVTTVVAARHKVQVLSYLNAFVSSQDFTIDSDITGNTSAKINFNDGTSTNFVISITDIIEYYHVLGIWPKALAILNNDSIHVKNEAKVWKYDIGTYWHVVTNQLD